MAQFEEDEILVIGFDRDLPLGEGVLTMDFTGTLNDQMRGFYRRYTLPLTVLVSCEWQTPIIPSWYVLSVV